MSLQQFGMRHAYSLVVSDVDKFIDIVDESSKIVEVAVCCSALGCTKAVSVLTSDATAFANNETVTIGGVVYTFKTTLTGAAYEVLIGADAKTSLDNLKLAINRTDPGTNEGVKYGIGTLAHPNVTATTNTDTAQTIEAILAGTAANAIATTETCAHAAWPGATMNSGTPGTDVSLQLRACANGQGPTAGTAILTTPLLLAPLPDVVYKGVIDLTHNVLNKLLHTHLAVDFTGTTTPLAGVLFIKRRRLTGVY